MPLRPLGQSGICVTPIAMGCWPITGITSVDVTRAQGLATLSAAFESGINFFDTAYCYGYEGESEKMIAEALGDHREQLVIASKGGIHWVDKQQARDGSPATIIRECEESLRRLQTDYIDLHYLHAPDPNVSVAVSAEAFRDLIDTKKIRAAGISNCSAAQLKEFASVCPLTAYQPHYNMLQREIEAEQLPWCREHNVAVVIYWPLMKGLLAGKMTRDYQFDERDGRRKYPMFQGDEWEKNHDFIDTLRTIADEIGTTVAQLVINWTIEQTGITAALCGAKRPEQIRDNAAAMTWSLTAEQLARINRAIAERGPAISRGAV
ncbi:MAG: aldo/keto reductase [Planctomycetota bacterium]|nr:aldo/keto reductase [Planctomycetota bacterium]MDA1211602.1 aldo/keto reductase [Planctomycetota bacterium]